MMPKARSSLLTAALVAMSCLSAASRVLAEDDCCDPAGPFAPGENVADRRATCETIGYWLDRAPETQARITMVITGPLVSISEDEALAHLIMCEPAGVQVMCVTYGTGDFAPGEVATFAGGFSRAGEGRIMLDPCLASRG